ncbi:hypothetical protein [Pseudooctadecabacter sp.]|uniref:hypothetical protein n=1 Tax=Pseudooctadecabacter sp. TaxID=1966338 RepID=UPI0035C8547E
MRRLALAMILAPAIAAATPYDGIYRQNANAECALVGVDGGALRIEDGIFYGVELECRMTRPVNVVDMDATLYTMNCSGNDEVWTERAMLMHDAEDDGIIMIWDGYAFRYSRCPDLDATVEDAAAATDG